ncbi:interferon-induced transmembrane protein 10-like [Rana temporaria]|uniref:interferon-induced transmembrane protein 10-like n=1 Tax=Rana temporaria TaxID=8407 RepID=UPI001AACC45E|nr:interferon-induced transmembrane protein 10-like [Rana temporaria]
MSLEDNLYEAPDFGHQDNPPSCYEQAIPVMDTQQPTFYPGPPEYVEVLPDLPPRGIVNPPPNLINNPSEGAFSKPTVIPSQRWTYPQEVGISRQQPNNNQQIIQRPPPMHNPEFLTQTVPRTVFLQPMVYPSPQSAMTPGMMPLQQYPQNCAVPGTMVINTVQPTMVTTQTTMISTQGQAPPCRDYLPWSIVNLIFCCLIFGIVALVFSLQTRSAKKYQDWESAQRKSRAALGFNLAAMLLGIALIIIVPAVYFTRPYYYYYYYG